MELYNLNYSHIKPSDQYPLHKQDTWELTLIIKGSGRRVIGDSQTTFGEGNLALIPPHIFIRQRLCLSPH